MKKIISVLFTSLIILLMFVGPGNVAMAHENGDENCSCGWFILLDGSESNKTVSKLLSSEEFKNVKLDMLKNGYQWKGISNAQVMEIVEEMPFATKGSNGVAVPFYNNDGSIKVLFFINGKLMPI